MTVASAPAIALRDGDRVGPDEPIGSLVVFIAGGSGSGKTPLAEAVRHAFPPGTCTVVDQDAYYRGIPPEQFSAARDINFDHPDSLDVPLLVAHLDGLRRGQAIDKPVFDFERHRRTDAVVRIEASRVVLLEGTMILHVDDLRSRADVRIFLDVPDDVRAFWRITRDLRERERDIDEIRHRWMTSVQPMYEALIRPSRVHADMVIPGGFDNTRAVGLLVDAIRGRLCGASAATPPLVTPPLAG